MTTSILGDPAVYPYVTLRVETPFKAAPRWAIRSGGSLVGELPIETPIHEAAAAYVSAVRDQLSRRIAEHKALTDKLLADTQATYERLNAELKEKGFTR